MSYWLHYKLMKSIPHAVSSSPFLFILNLCFMDLDSMSRSGNNITIISISKQSIVLFIFCLKFHLLTFSLSPIVSVLYAGPYWTHVLFTWTQTEGLKVYINGTFSKEDPTGSVSHNYGDPYADLVIGTGNTGSYGHYATGAFDEFVIWERALSPQDVWMYYKAAIGK